MLKTTLEVYIAIWIFRYTFICQNKLAEMYWSC